MKFVKSNYIFLIWCVIYAFILTMIAIDDLQLFFILLGAEVVSLALAFSPVGEWLLRTMSGARKLKRDKDKEYLLPLFNAVYEDAKRVNPKLSKKIEVYIDKDKNINAYAFGSNSISVTRGALENLSEDELKGVIAHEFGHISNHDTKVTLVMTIGNGAFTVLWLILKFVMTRGKYKDDLGFVLLFNAMIGFIVRCFTAIGDRQNEYMADEFAHSIGHGEGLLETLRIFRAMSAGQKMRLRDRMRATHPHLKKRIARLEGLQQKESEKENIDNAEIEKFTVNF